MIRSNIAHGEKTPFGPDLQKSERDADVLVVALPVLDEILARFLEWPCRKLAVYGTLRRGFPNHSKIADLGVPVVGWVNGTVSEELGDPLYRWITSSPEVEVELYESSKLSADRWQSLDRFEGSRYRQMLVPVRVKNGTRSIATIYADARY
jgi:gamma-glutamylcyclotransferase (GGCT)/AIG2-like uncharacterized protein YtfP